MTATIRLLGPVAALLAGFAVAMPASAQEPPPLIYGLEVEQLELRAGDGEGRGVAAWDADAVVGGDKWKLRLESKGEFDRDADAFETLETQFAVQRLISDFFDLKVGVRFDTPDGPDRSYAVVGAHGLAPHWFEIDLDLFLSDRGDLSARLDVEYDLLLTNRLILTPALEVDVAASDDRGAGIAAGLVGTELGLRLRYELIDRTLAPYLGVHYEQLYGRTADLARREGEDSDGIFLVAGVRLFF